MNNKDRLKTQTPSEALSILIKSSETRSRLLKQLEQLGIEIGDYESLSLNDLLFKIEDLMRNTYSIKYLGLNQNEMGIISKRINPLMDKNYKIQEVSQGYNITKYFYPKPLRCGTVKKEKEQKINVFNLENKIKRQFENNKDRQEEIKVSHKCASGYAKTGSNMSGSWVNFNATATKFRSTKKQNRPLRMTKEKELGIIGDFKLQEKERKTNSYSRYLGKGLLVVRD